MKLVELNSSAASPDAVVLEDILARYPFRDGEKAAFLKKVAAIPELSEYGKVDAILRALGNPNAAIRSVAPAKLRPSSAPDYEIRDGVFFARIPSWDTSTVPGGEQPFHEMIRAALRHKNEIKGVMIDVRGNTGGNSAIAQEFARLFIAKDVRYGKLERRGEGDELVAKPAVFRANKGPCLNKPVVLLTDSICFGTNELFIAPFKASGRATLIGERTKGGSSVPHILPVRLEGNDYTVQIPTSRLYLSGHDKPLEQTGVVPNIEIRGDVFDRALAVLRQMMGPGSPAAAKIKVVGARSARGRSRRPSCSLQG